MLRRYSTLIAIVFGFAGCATTGDNRSEVTRDPQLATIVGWGASGSEILAAPFALPLGSSIVALYVKKINDKPVESENNITKIPAGAHSLTVYCSARIDAMRSYTDSVIKVNVEAGKVYELKGQMSTVNTRPPQILCNPSLIDSTEKFLTAK